MKPPSEDIHLSPEGSGGWADPIGNDTILPNPIFLDTASYLIKKRFPLPLLLTYFHEATHHWCFESRLGYCVSALWLRARRRAYDLSNIENPSVDDRYDFLDDVIRYWSIVLLMRPIAEGMALFAEHDLYSRPENLNEILPPFYSWAMVEATEHKEESPIAQSEKKLLDYLSGLRLSGNGVKRKRNLLVRSLSTKDGGYLAGYLTLKTLWLQMSTRSPRLFDQKGLFLSFIRERLFNDKAFIAKLFEPGYQDVRIPERLATALQAQVKSLLTIGDDDVAAHDAGTLSWPVPKPDGYQAQDLPEAVADIFKELSETEHPLRVNDIETLNRRHLMRVFSAEATINVSHQRVKVYSPNFDPLKGETRVPIFSFPILPGTAEGESKGLIEYHISLTYQYWGILVFRDGSLVASMVPEDRTNDIKEYAIAGGVEGLREIRDVSQMAIEEMIAAHDLQMERDMALDRVREFTESFYSTLALPVKTAEELEKCKALMSNEGFWSFFEEDIELTSALSVCSAVSAAFLNVEQMPELLEEVGASLEAIDRVRARGESLGFPLFAGEGDLTLCLV